MQTVFWHAVAYGLICTHRAVPSQIEEFRNLGYWKGKKLKCQFCNEEKEVVGLGVVSIQYDYEVLKYAKINQKP